MPPSHFVCFFLYFLFHFRFQKFFFCSFFVKKIIYFMVQLSSICLAMMMVIIIILHIHICIVPTINFFLVMHTIAAIKMNLLVRYSLPRQAKKSKEVGRKTFQVSLINNRSVYFIKMCCTDCQT